MGRRRVSKYVKDYKVSNITAMIRNNRRDPKVCKDEFRGKLVVITGATSGIGRYTARKYAVMGANLLCINRNEEKSSILKSEIEKEFGVKCDYLIADFSVMEDVHRVSNELKKLDKPIDVLIHNAGVYLTRKEVTSEGYDKVFMVHYLSSFIMNVMLIEKLTSQEHARIILVNSEGHRFAAWGLKMDDLHWERHRYSGLKSYGSAKLAQLLSMQVFDEYFKGTGVTINAMHPGAVKSETGQDNGRFYRYIKRNVYDKILRSTEISAEALYFLGVSRDLDNVSAKFFNLTTEEDPAPPALDMEAARQLWDLSINMGKVKEVIRLLENRESVKNKTR